MAELDDFFAKKDKKKSKTKSKFVTADELVKNLEECTKREVAANAVKPKKPDVATASAGGVAEGGENETNIKAPEPVVEVRVSSQFSNAHFQRFLCCVFQEGRRGGVERVRAGAAQGLQRPQNWPADHHR